MATYPAKETKQQKEQGGWQGVVKNLKKGLSYMGGVRNPLPTISLISFHSTF